MIIMLYNVYMKILYIFIGIIILWSIWGYFSSRVENAEYFVIEEKNGYEIRLYPQHIVAQTVVDGSYDQALNQGFRIVAGYIFGGNTKKEKIAMTAPVVEQGVGSSNSESIAMTAPVTASLNGGAHTISFGMPRSYTIDSLPTPTDPRVSIVTVPEKKMAVLRFSWFSNADRINSKKQELLDALMRDKMEVVGEPQFAGYDAPWTPPWMTRNEIMVEIK
jgi:effector-binding domain-containing protein